TILTQRVPFRDGTRCVKGVLHPAAAPNLPFYRAPDMRRRFVAPGGLPLKSNGDPSATRPRTRNATPCSSDYAPLARREVMNDEFPALVPLTHCVPSEK